ncbi:hypothetical protein Tco_0110165 [Tanacetum coccineum]
MPVSVMRQCYIMADVNARFEQALAVCTTHSHLMNKSCLHSYGTPGVTSVLMDEHGFQPTKDTLRDALRITPVNNNKAFSSHLTQDTLINFVNDLGYPKEVKHLSNVVTNDMFQPWRALTTIINLCLTGKTSGFERPRAPVLQILWGVINRAHIDYADKIVGGGVRDEFTQSIHTFTKDKKNLAQYTQGNKKATLIVIPSVRFTKLVIFHLQRKHKFHPRPESPLHLLKRTYSGYHKFSAKGNQKGSLWKVRKHKATPPAKRAKAGKVVKKRTLKSSQRLVDEFVDEGIPLTEPGFGDLEADTQEYEESLMYAPVHLWVLFLLLVFREMTLEKSQPLSTPGVHAGPNLEHTDAEATDTTRTLSSLQHLAKDFSFGDQFFNDKPSEADNEKTTADTEAESMMSVTIHQDTSAIPYMTSPVIDLVSSPVINLVSRPDSPNVHRPLPTIATTIATTTTTTITTLPLSPQPQQGSSDPTLLKHIRELEQHIADLVDANQALEERLDKHGSRLYRLENQDIPNQVRKAVDEIVTDAVDWQASLRERFRDLPEADMKEILHNRIDQLLSDLAEARKKKKKRHDSPKTPPGSLPHPPPPAGPSRTSGASGASGSSQSPPPPPPLSNNQGGQIKPSVSPIPEELHMDDDMTADGQVYSSSGEDAERDHILTVNLRQSWWKPLTEDRPATPEPAWSIPSSALTVPTNN